MKRKFVHFVMFAFILPPRQQLFPVFPEVVGVEPVDVVHEVDQAGLEYINADPCYGWGAVT